MPATMKIIAAAAVLMVVGLSDASDPDFGLYCSDGYVKLGTLDFCYKFVTGPLKNHADAEAVCRTDGGKLVTLRNDDDKNILIEYVNEFFAGQYWTAGKRGGPSYFWQGGEVPNAMKGRTFQTRGEMCVYLCSITHKIWDAPCSSHKRFICEQRQQEAEVVTVGAF